MAERHERLDNALTAINHQIDELAQMGLDDTAKLLRIARLDLQMRRHAVSGQELRALCVALERQVVAADDRVVAFPTQRIRKRQR